MPNNGYFRENEKPVVCDAMQKFDKLLHRLDSLKPLLDQSAEVAANEIMTNFSSVISKLYNQRKMLLQQLERVVRNESSYIESQKRTMEALRLSVLNCISAGHEIDNHIHDYITKAADVSNNHSAPFVSFRNNNALLDQAIAAYGRIVVRHYGHLADPSLPSACLSLEVDEEEDDHDQETSDAQSDIFCTCADPSLQKWLLNPHLLDPGSLCRGLCHSLTNKMDLDTAQLVRQRPGYDLSTWLDQTKRPVKCLRRKLSNSFTTVDSDYSESCPLSVNPSSTGCKSRDWLLVNHMNTGDKSGFSNKESYIVPPVEVQPQTSNDIEDLNQWLLPSTVKSTKRKASAKAGEDCFIQSDHAEDLVAVSCDAEMMPVNSSVQGCPPTVAKETSGYDCIYSHCRGGPGGPTCCGGRPRPAAVVVAPNLTADNTTSRSTTMGQVTCSIVKSDAGCPFVSPSANVNGTPAVELHPPQSSGFAVVNQLISIANSSLHHWLVSSPIISNSEQSAKCSVDEDLVEVSVPYDTSKWLLPSETVNKEDGKAGQKPATLCQPHGHDYEAWLSTKLLTCASTT